MLTHAPRNLVPTRYYSLLKEAKARGIVESVTNLVDEHLVPVEKADPRLLPYLEGERWIGEAETMIKVFCPLDYCVGRY